MEGIFFNGYEFDMERYNGSGSNRFLVSKYGSFENYNHVRPDGTFLSDTWWQRAEQFYEGFAVVCRHEDYRCNHIDIEGKLLSDTWWDITERFNEGFAAVENGKGLWNHIDTEGKILCEGKWWKHTFAFREGFAVVRRHSDDKFNWIDRKGKLLSETWWGWCRSFHGGFASVEREEDGRVNFIDTKGRLVSERWFSATGSHFSNGFVAVRDSWGLLGEDVRGSCGLPGEYNFLATDGSLLLKDNAEWAGNFEGGIAEVLIGNRKRMVMTDGTII